MLSLFFFPLENFQHLFFFCVCYFYFEKKKFKFSPPPSSLGIELRIVSVVNGKSDRTVRWGGGGRRITCVCLSVFFTLYTKLKVNTRSLLNSQSRKERRKMGRKQLKGRNEATNTLAHYLFWELFFSGPDPERKKREKWTNADFISGVLLCTRSFEYIASSSGAFV